MGGLKPDHKTIARFRKEDRASIKKILKQCARLCIKLGLIEGNTLFVDGSKIRANASIGNTWTEKRCELYLKHIDRHIESILAECESIDDKESNNSPLVNCKEELKNKETLKSKIEGIEKELKRKNIEGVNTTDHDCVKVKCRQGTHAGYNSQIVVDEKHVLIVESDAVSESNDLNQFACQITEANATLDKPCQNACADAGYADTDNLKEIHDKGITVIVPSQKQASNRPIKPFDKENFQYDINNDCYTCPEGHLLTYSHFCKDKSHLGSIRSKTRPSVLPAGILAYAQNQKTADEYDGLSMKTSK